jgi:hypothetical protein
MGGAGRGGGRAHEADSKQVNETHSEQTNQKGKGKAMSIVMLVNLKGGVAKTTTAVAVAECLASDNYRVLLIDADHQCMAGELLLGEGGQVKAEQSKRNLFNLFMDTMFIDADLTAEEFEKRVTARRRTSAAAWRNSRFFHVRYVWTRLRTRYASV